MLKPVLMIGLMLSVSSLSLTVYAVDPHQAERLRELLNLDIADLGEVDIKLDDVFDVFDGLVKPQSVTVASGIQQSTATAPASTTVITAQDIEAMGARTVAEVLEAVPGIHISLSEVGFQPLYDVRGMHSAANYEVLFMVNGIPIKSVTTGSRGNFWSPPPVQYIRRIEVIRGPGSALYGADAVSGVVNIMTKTQDDMRGTEIGLRADSLQTYNPWLLYGGVFKGFKLSLSIDYFDTEGHEETIYQDAQTLLDNAAGTRLSHTPGRGYLQNQKLDMRAHLSKDHWHLSLAWQRTRDAGDGVGGAFVVSPDSYEAVDEWLADIHYHNPQFTQHWETFFRLSYRDSANEIFNIYTALPGSIRNDQPLPFGAPNNTAYKQRQTRLDLSGSYRGFEQHTVRLGAGYYYADLHEVSWSFLLDPTVPTLVNVRPLGLILIPENIRRNWYAFVQDTWAFAPDWELTAGVRHDWYSDFESTTNPRAALVWKITPRLISKLLFGTAFRAPSFTEMYTPRNRVIVGNPNLEAEKNTTWELGFDYRASDTLNLTANLFHYEVKDKILRRLLEQADRTILMYDNTGTLEGQGIELESRWKINAKSSLLLNYAYVHVETETGDEAGNYPHHQVYLRHDWLLGQSWFLDTRLNWVVDRDRPVNDLREPLHDYLEVGLTLRYKDVSENTPWNIAVGVRNLLDEDRREPGDPRFIGDYPKAGREWFTEVRYQF